jgi:hypothetical protein
MLEQMICEWCYNETKLYVTATFVVCTGRIDTMQVKEHFVCSEHAEKLCAHFQGRRGMVGGTTFDEWELRPVTEAAHEFFNQRAAERLIAAARRATRKGNLPYTLPKSDPGRVRREKWVYRYPTEIRGTLPLH